MNKQAEIRLELMRVEAERLKVVFLQMERELRTAEKVWHMEKVPLITEIPRRIGTLLARIVKAQLHDSY